MKLFQKNTYSTSAKEERVNLSWRNVCATASEGRSCISTLKNLPSKLVKKTSMSATKDKDNEKDSSAERAAPATKDKKILKNIHGTCRAGEVIAVMGSSGAGKSTLLNVLLQRNLNNLNISGQIYVNGRKYQLNALQGVIKSVSAYVQQDDLFIGTITVKEHLTFHAMLRMPAHVNNSDRRKRVDTVIRELNLSGCQNTLIGVAGKLKTISGGEAKRLSFASEILLNPALLFCDEPTSGLDSFMAENVVQTLKSLAQKGKAILCTIHQPSSAAFNLFDKIILLSEGRLAFTGSLAECQQFFADAGYGCPANYNPADHYIHQLAIRPESADECRKRAGAVCDRFKQSDRHNAILRQIDADAEAAQGEQSSNAKGAKPGLDERRYRANWCRQFYWLIWRAWLSFARNKKLTIARVMQSIVIGGFVGVVYFHKGQELDKERTIQDINGVLFFSISFATFTNVYAVFNSLPAEMRVFLRDSQNMVYRSTPYFLAKSIVDIPIFTFLSVLFAAIVYWMCQLRYDGDITYFLNFLGIHILLCHTCISVGYFISTATCDVDMAIAIASPLIIPLMLFGGLFINQGDIPDCFTWIQWISWYRYTNEILIVNQYHGLKKINCGHGMGKNCTGNQIISQLSYDEAYVPRDMICLAGLFIGFRFLSWLCVILRARSTR